MANGSIVTQDGDIINYANVVRIAVFTISNSAEDIPEAAEIIYLIEAETNIVPMDEGTETSFTLAAYDDMEKAENVMEQIIKWLEKGMIGTFRMPE